MSGVGTGWSGYFWEVTHTHHRQTYAHAYAHTHTQGYYVSPVSIASVIFAKAQVVAFAVTFAVIYAVQPCVVCRGASRN